jgi:hypothetical protein
MKETEKKEVRKQLTVVMTEEPETPGNGEVSNESPGEGVEALPGGEGGEP